jgi:hypothetical protein
LRARAGGDVELGRVVRVAHHVAITALLGRSWVVIAILFDS